MQSVLRADGCETRYRTTQASSPVVGHRNLRYALRGTARAKRARALECQLRCGEASAGTEGSNHCYWETSNEIRSRSHRVWTGLRRTNDTAADGTRSISYRQHGRQVDEDQDRIQPRAGTSFVNMRR